MNYLFKILAAVLALGVILLQGCQTYVEDQSKYLSFDKYNQSLNKAKEVVYTGENGIEDLKSNGIDIDNLDSSMRDYLISNGIKLCCYTEDPFEFYVSSLIIVIPTLYAEGLSRVALEAGLLGVPIASVSNRGITSLFMDGILGEYTLD